MLLTLTDEEKAIDQKLGYPLGYAKLCRHALAQPQGVLTPFTEGPPQRFVPYTPPPEDLQRLREWEGIFPVVPDSDKEAPHAHEYAEELWEQLDHLGNAGFDPAKFRVDAYGNVLYWSADPSSPLSWEVDHWFPHSRGGRTLPSNLQIVQWQARQRKKNRLEFLVPWWDLQHGVSINQFLSAFASKNTEFRRRSFALFFAGGEDENVVRQHVGDCRPWPPQFRDKKAQCGLAGAAIASSVKDTENIPRIPNSARSAILSNLESTSLTESSNRRRWSVEEEEGLRRAVQTYGPGSWKEIKEHEPALVNRSTAQIKEKYRLMRSDWHLGKENNGIASAATSRGDNERQSIVTNAMQKELRLKMMREEGKREKEEEVTQLEETVRSLKEQNEKDRVAILGLEGELSKQKQRVEKQRRWAETQSSYRLCLERMIRDTMHQSISYKEQARLNQAACNALMARLDCQKMTCDAAEKDLLQRYSQREALAALVRLDPNEIALKKPLRGQDIVDVSSCLSLVTTNDGRVVTPEKGFPHGDVSAQCSDNETDDGDDAPTLRMRKRRSSESVLQEKITLPQKLTPNKCRKDTLHTDLANKKTTSIVFTPSQKEEQAVLMKDSEKDFETEAQITRNVENQKEEETEPCEISKAKETAVTESEISEAKEENDQVKTDSNENITETEKAVDATNDTQSSCSEAEPDGKEHESVKVEIETANPPAMSDGGKHIDELMQEVIVTHEDRIKSAEAAAQGPTTLDDESIRKIGKSNIDKWLHVLLDDESPRISTDVASPPSDSVQPPLSPAMSTLSMAALRGSVELDEGRDDDFLKKEGEEKLKGRWTGLMRKLSVKHPEEDCSVDLSPRADNRHNLRNALKSFEDFKMKDEKDEEQLQTESTSGLSSGSVIPESVRNWPEGGIKPKGGADWYKDSSLTSEKSPHSKSLKEDSVSTQVENTHKRCISEDDEVVDCESLSSGNRDSFSQALEQRDGLYHKHGLRASLKACTLKWRRAVKKLDRPLQEGSIPLPP